VTVGTVIAIYFIIWWVVLFAVLPWGVRSQHESGDIAPGTEPGAPAVHLVWKKLLWTTLVASTVFALAYALYRFNPVPMDWLIEISNPPHR
jgi:predicted secreted protein